MTPAVSVNSSVLASVFLTAPATSSVDEPSNIALLLGCVGVVLAMVGLWWTRYRYVLGYFFAGMAYWLVVEGVRWGVVHVSNLAGAPAYVLALAITFIPLAWVVSLPSAQLDLPAIPRKPIFNKTTLNHLRPNLRHRRSRTLPQPRQSIGERPIALKKDTEFYQRVIRHRPVMDTKR